MTAEIENLTAWRAVKAERTQERELATAIRERIATICDLRRRWVIAPDPDTAQQLANLEQMAVSGFEAALRALRSVQSEHPEQWWYITGLETSEIAPWLFEFRLIGDGTA